MIWRLASDFVQLVELAYGMPASGFDALNWVHHRVGARKKKTKYLIVCLTCPASHLWTVMSSASPVSVDGHGSGSLAMPP